MSTGPFNLPGQSFAASPPYAADASGAVTADQQNITADGLLTGPFIRVQAKQSGFYNGMWRDIGDVFDIYFGGEFSSVGRTYTPANNPVPNLPGWLLMVPSSTPLFAYSLSNGQGASDAPAASKGTNAGGQKVYGNQRAYVL